MGRDDLEQLHEEASAHYLKGDYREALSSWCRLLDLDPQDEQALEGVRLCRHLSGEDLTPRLSEAPAGQAEAQPPGMPSGFGDLASHLFDDDEPLLDGANSLAGLGSFAESEDDPHDGSAPLRGLTDSLADLAGGMGAPEDDRPRPAVIAGGEGPLDLSDLEGAVFDDDTLELTSEAPVPDAPAPAAAAADAAPAELRRRVNALLASALAAMEREERDEALSVLGRVLILDDQNEAALSLRDKILREVDLDSKSAAATPSRQADPEDDVWHEEGSVPPPASVTSAVERAPTPVRVPDPPPAPSAAQGAAAPAPAARAPAAVKPARRMPAGIGALANWRPAPRTLAIAGGLLLAVIGVVLAVRWMSGGAEAETPAVAAGSEAGERPQSAARDKAAAAHERRAKGAAAASSDAAALVGKGDTAAAKGDFANAIVAYNQALKVTPDDPLLQQKLLNAGARYREQHELDTQWDQITRGFENGDYQNALRLLYRLPKSEDQVAINRYLLNGWHNLGVEALRGGDCNQALSHLREAKSINAGDAGVAAALRLAQSCAIERRSTSFRIAAENLRLRGMKD